MKNIFFSFFILFCHFFYTYACEPVDYVDPLIDSHKSRWFYFQSACRPFGMVSLSPDTWVIGTWMKLFQIDVPVRFDIITVIGENGNFRIDHIKEAFYPPLF